MALLPRYLRKYMTRQAGDAVFNSPAISSSASLIDMPDKITERHRFAI